MSASRHSLKEAPAQGGPTGGIVPNAGFTSNFLDQLSPTDRAGLEALGRVRQFASGERVFRAGEAGSHVYFLQTGKLRIVQLSPLGRDVILWFCLPGEICGLAEVARGGGRVVSAVACEPSGVVAVSQEQFRQFLLERPHVALLSMQVLASRLRVLGEMFVNLVSDDVNTRITKLILRLCARYGRREGSEVVLDIPLTHQEIADMVGTTRQTATSVLSSLRRAGVLSIDNHRIRIGQEKSLADIAGRKP